MKIHGWNCWCYGCRLRSPSRFTPSFWIGWTELPWVTGKISFPISAAASRTASSLAESKDPDERMAPRPGWGSLDLLSPRLRDSSRARDDSLFLRLRHEAITHAANRQQMSRFRRIVFDIAAQANDEIVDGAGVGVFVQSPYFFENRLAGDDPSLVSYEMAQQFRFHQGQL